MSVDYQSGGLPYRLPVKGSSINWRKGGGGRGGCQGVIQIFHSEESKRGKEGRE